MQMIKEKRVLIIAPHLNKQGGVSNYYTSISSHLPENYEFIFRGTKKNKPNIFHYLVDYLLTLLKLIFKEITSKYDCVVVNHSLSKFSIYRDILYILILNLFRIRFIVFFRGWNQDFANRINTLELFLLRKLFFKAYKIIVLSSSFKKQLFDLGYNNNIIIETTTVNEKIVPIEYIKKEKENGINILFLSRIIKAKGIFELLDAFKILKKKYSYIKLTYAGDGEDLPELKKKVKKEAINNINFTGYIRGKKKCETFLDSDIFIFPSYGEGMPNSVLEAAAYGLPIIATDVGGLKDVFEQGKNILFLDNLKPKHIAEMIEYLICNLEKRKKMSEDNYKLAKEKFYSTKVTERLIKIIEEKNAK